MADLQEILSSISDEDMAKIKNIANSLLSNNQPTETAKPTQNFVPNFPLDEKMMSKIMTLMGQFNKEDNRTRLIMDLKPLLNTERQKRADEAVKFLQLMEILPLIRGMFANE